MTPRTPNQAIAATRTWVERAVIGLDLCPFARAVSDSGRIRYAVSDARTPEALLGDLVQELRFLAESERVTVATTLLIHPHVLTEFLDYNEFLDVADVAVEHLGLAGVLQVASFHPRYQFAGTSADDSTNNTNRSPYPTLHLLREAMVAEAVAALPQPEAIYQKNIETMRRLGASGWAALGVEAP